jgi:hypothetical protein
MDGKGGGGSMEANLAGILLSEKIRLPPLWIADICDCFCIYPHQTAETFEAADCEGNNLPKNESSSRMPDSNTTLT